MTFGLYLAKVRLGLGGVWVMSGVSLVMFGEG